MQETIYLDYASTHPRNSFVMSDREGFEQSSYANIWRGNYDRAERAMVAYQNSKKSFASWVGCDPYDIIYTYSCTYAINLIALALEQNNILKKGDVILLSVSEHHANIVPWHMLAQRTGAILRFVHVDNGYHIDLNDLSAKLDSSVKVVSLQYASNVTGALHPLEQIRSLIGEERLFFVDAAQMGIHGPLNFSEIWCDAMFFSGHKMMADSGLGILVLKKILQKAWQCPLGGGWAINFVSEKTYEQSGLPERWEPGTPHITWAVTLASALQLLSAFSGEKRGQYQELVRYISTRFDDFFSSRKGSCYHASEPSIWVWSFSLEWKHPVDIAEFLSRHDICVRAGHHCCEPLHAYLWSPGTVRISIGHETTKNEIDTFFEVLMSF